MKKDKNWLIFLICGALVITFAIVLLFLKTDDSESVIRKVVFIICGALIIIYAFLIVYSQMQKYKNNLCRLLLLAELIINVIIGVIYIVKSSQAGDGELNAGWIAGVFYMRGVNTLLINHVTTGKGRTIDRVVIGIVLVTFGTWAYFSRFFTSEFPIWSPTKWILSDFLFFLLIALGVYCIVQAFLLKEKTKKSSK